VALWRADLIDIDPFGSPAPFFDAALTALRPTGTLVRQRTASSAVGPMAGGLAPWPSIPACHQPRSRMHVLRRGLPHLSKRRPGLTAGPLSRLQPQSVAPFIAPLANGSPSHGLCARKPAPPRPAPPVSAFVSSPFVRSFVFSFGCKAVCLLRWLASRRH
jgi:hypothetical protein